MQKPKAADFDNEQDYLNNWAGWQVNTGSWSEPVPTDWKAPVVTPPTPVAQTSPQPNGMLTNTATPQMAVEGSPKPEAVAQSSPQPDGMLANALTPQMAVEGSPKPEAVASVPRPADYTSETDFLNAMAGYRINTGEFNLTPDDYSAWGNYQDSLSTPTEDKYEAPPANYVPEYVKPETTQIEDLFSNELGGSTEAGDPFAIDVESEDTYVSPPDGYVPEYIEQVEYGAPDKNNQATGALEDADASTDLNLADDGYTDFEVDYDNIDLSSLDNTENQDAVLPEGFTEYTGGTLGENFVPDWWPTYEEGVYAGQPVHYANLNDSQKELAKEYYTWADSFIEEGGSFGTGANLGDSPNLLYSREQTSTELYNSMTKQLEDLGLTPDDIDGDLLEMARMSGGSDTADQTERDTGYELFIRQVNPYITEKNQAERQALYDSFGTGDMESFKSEFSSADINTQANLMYRLYSEGGLSEEEYRKSMAGVHQEANPDYLYFFDDDELFRVAKETYEEDPDFAMSRGAIEYIRLFPDSGAYNYTDSEDVRGIDWEERFARSLGIPTDNYHFSDDNSFWVDARDKVIIPLGRAALALYTSGLTEKLYTAYKVATCETLNASDYVNIVVGGLEATGVIAPPVDISGDMVNPIAGGTVGGQIGSELLLGGSLTDGVGLWGLDYASTVGVLNAAINQDPIGVIAAGTGWMQQGFESLGVPSSVANDVDFLKAARETMNMLADGESVQDSMEAGFERYIKEGGGFGIELDDGGFFDFDFGVVGDVFDYVSDVVGTVSSTLGDYIDPVLQGAVDIGQDVSSALGDYIDPVVEAVADAVEPIVDAADDAIDYVVDTADDAIDYVGDRLEDVKDALPTGTTPEIELSLDLPTGTTPDGFDLDLESSGESSPTKTTDYAFSDLFNLDTQIGISPYEELINTDPFGRTI